MFKEYKEFYTKYSDIIRKESKEISIEKVGD
jgi:hypothetical protein